jgi:hypothetical protein
VLILLLICLWLVWLCNPTVDGFIIMLGLTCLTLGITILLFPAENSNRAPGVMLFIIGVLIEVYVYMNGLMFDG